MTNILILINDKEVFQFRSDRIVCVASDGNYSVFRMADGDNCLVTCQLCQIEKMISDQIGPDGITFIRTGRSLIVNMDYIYYLNPSKKKLVLCDSQNVKMEQTASVEALRMLKDYLEQELKRRMSQR